MGEEAEARRREAEGGAVGEVVDALEHTQQQLMRQLGQPVRGRSVGGGSRARGHECSEAEPGATRLAVLLLLLLLLLLRPRRGGHLRGLVKPVRFRGPGMCVYVKPRA